MSEIRGLPQPPDLEKLSELSPSFSQKLLIVSLLLVFILSVIYHGRRWKWYYHSWNVPGPLAFPFIGSAYKLFGEPARRTNGFMGLLRSYPDIVKVWLGPKLVYLISKPEYIEKLINQPSLMDKDDFYDALVGFIGDGLITAKGAKWKSHRKLMNRSFGQKMLDGFVATFDEKASILIEIIKQHVGRKDIPIFRLASRCHLDSICGTTMGVTMNVQTTKDFLGELPHRFSELFGRSNFMIRYQFKFIWDHSADKKVLARCAKMANDFSDSVVEKKLKEHEEKKQNESCDHVVEDGSTIRRKAVLDLLIESSQMTEAELKDEVITILAAATDTTANSSIYILLVLGLYPDVQQKVFEEVVEVMGSEKSVIPEHLLRMEYTERVIKEALRVLPVIALISRYASEDVEIGDYVAPAGTSICIPILYIHRCARYWKDPLKFDPDRFLPENVAKRHPLSYIPFSSGIRNCIGWRYAMMNLTTFTARVVREFKVFTQYKSLEEIQVEMHVFTKIKDGPKLWFETRT